MEPVAREAVALMQPAETGEMLTAEEGFVGFAVVIEGPHGAREISAGGGDRAAFASGAEDFVLAEALGGPITEAADGLAPKPCSRLLRFRQSEKTGPMPKAVSPVRLQQELMQRATLAGARHHRSAAEQIEYWAALGQQVAGILDPDKLLDVMTGLAGLKVVPIATAPVDPELAFAALEQQRRCGQLSQSASGASLRYQASTAEPGLLEEINPNGMRRLGHFRDGVFEPLEITTLSNTP